MRFRNCRGCDATVSIHTECPAILISQTCGRAEGRNSLLAHNDRQIFIAK